MVKERMVKDVNEVLEESRAFVTNRLIIESLNKNGKVTMEEASFLDSLARDVIEQAKEQFIPDSINVPEVQESVVTKAVVAPEKAAEAEANKPLEESTGAPEGADNEVPKADAEANKPLEESTGAPEGADEVNGKTEPKLEELTESEAIVNALLKKMI